MNIFQTFLIYHASFLNLKTDVPIPREEYAFPIFVYDTFKRQFQAAQG